jgi:hypothetical protein
MLCRFVRTVKSLNSLSELSSVCQFLFDTIYKQIFILPNWPELFDKHAKVGWTVCKTRPKSSKLELWKISDSFSELDSLTVYYCAR